MKRLSFWEIDTATRVRILNKAVSISHWAYIPGKDMNTTILHAVISKQ